MQFTLPGYGTATAKMLTAPSLTSTTGVNYAGQTFDGSTDGALQSSISAQSLSPQSGIYTNQMPRASAALLAIVPWDVNGSAQASRGAPIRSWLSFFCTPHPLAAVMWFICRPPNEGLLFQNNHRCNGLSRARPRNRFIRLSPRATR